MSEFGKDINVPSRKGVFIPDITVEMFRNASLEGVEDLLASGEMEDISLPSARPYTDEEIQKLQELEEAQLEKMYELGYQAGCAAQPERQKGEWIDYTEDGYVECPFCHNATNCDGNKDELHFCFSCGADMREDDHEIAR